MALKLHSYTSRPANTLQSHRILTGRSCCSLLLLVPNKNVLALACQLSFFKIMLPSCVASPAYVIVGSLLPGVVAKGQKSPRSVDKNKRKTMQLKKTDRQTKWPGPGPFTAGFRGQGLSSCSILFRSLSSFHLCFCSFRFLLCLLPCSETTHDAHDIIIPGLSDSEGILYYVVPCRELFTEKGKEACNARRRTHDVYSLSAYAYVLGQVRSGQVGPANEDNGVFLAVP